MPPTCSRCHTPLYGRSVCGNCGRENNLPLPAIPANQFENTRSKNSLGSFLAACFALFGIGVVGFAVVAVIAVQRAASPAGKTSVAGQVKQQAAHKKSLTRVAAKAKQDEAHPVYGNQTQKLPVITVSPTALGSQAYDLLDPFISKAYPGSLVKITYSTRHSEEVDYQVTEPSGHKVRAVCTFVWNGGYPDDWRNTPGRYVLTENRELTDAEERKWAGAKVASNPTTDSQITEGSDRTTDESAPADYTSSPEYKLADIEKGPLDPSDPLPRQIGAQLDALETKCDDPQGKQHNRAGLAAMALKVHDDLKSKGIDEDFLSILTNVNASIPPGQSMGDHIADVFAAYYMNRIPQ